MGTKTPVISFQEEIGRMRRELDAATERAEKAERELLIAKSYEPDLFIARESIKAANMRAELAENDRDRLRDMVETLVEEVEPATDDPRDRISMYRKKIKKEARELLAATPQDQQKGGDADAGTRTS